MSDEVPNEKSVRMPALYLGHGAPPLLDDPIWPVQLASWARSIPRPEAVLMVSAHWEPAPLAIAATTRVPLVYDFWGFPERFYELPYPCAGAPALAARGTRLLGSHRPVSAITSRGLDHGAYVPLLVMYPDADVPVLQVSCQVSEPGICSRSAAACSAARRGRAHHRERLFDPRATVPRP